MNLYRSHKTVHKKLLVSNSICAFLPITWSKSLIIESLKCKNVLIVVVCYKVLFKFCIISSIIFFVFVFN